MSDAPRTVVDMTSNPRDRDTPDDDPGSYVGLTVETAEGRARERGWTTVRVLSPGMVITMEYLVGRLNLEVADGIVRRCWKG